MALSEEQYDARRQRIRDEFITTSNRARSKRDRELSHLFVQCGWTQQKIADKEGRTQHWVSYRLRFGRFCEFITTVIDVEKLPIDLSERRFRGFWETLGSEKRCAKMDEEGKFQEIYDSDDWQVQFAIDPPFNITERITEFCCDNRYRTKGELLEDIGAPEDTEQGSNKRISNAIDRVKSYHAGDLMVMEKTYAGDVKKYRFKQISNKAGIKTKAVTVIEELSPIVEEIHRCLSAKQPHDAVGLVRGHMGRLKNLIKKYS